MRTSIHRRPTFWSQLQHWISNVRNGYRPELHYMRGPGPATRLRMANLAAAA